MPGLGSIWIESPKLPRELIDVVTGHVRVWCLRENQALEEQFRGMGGGHQHDCRAWPTCFGVGCDHPVAQRFSRVSVGIGEGEELLRYRQAPHRLVEDERGERHVWPNAARERRAEAARSADVASPTPRAC